nr:unnamed protein product [Callosobruchus chinensis]
MLDAPLSHWRAVGDLSLFYRYLNGFCSCELTSTVPPLSKPAPQGVCSSYIRNQTMRLHLCPQGVRACNGLPGDVLVEPPSVGIFKSRVNKLPLT